MTTREKIEVLEHYERGGRVEIKQKDASGSVWAHTLKPDWNFYLYDYRPAPEQKMVPLGPEDVVGAIIRHKDFTGGWAAITGARKDGSEYDGAWIQSVSGTAVLIPWTVLASECEISRDGGKTWERCEKEADNASR